MNEDIKVTLGQTNFGPISEKGDAGDEKKLNFRGICLLKKRVFGDARPLANQCAYLKQEIK